MINSKPVRLSDLAQRLLWLDGQPFSLRDYPMYVPIYDGRYRSTLMMCGRQVGKSSSLANFIISESMAMPFFRSLYVAPSKEQTLIFSNSRLGKTLAYSPLVRRHFQSPEHADRVLHRSYTNGSENYLSYADDDPDRARGITADRVSFDELQDMVYDAVIPVIKKSMSASQYKFETYAGTPKTMEASIQYLWERSTQSEWVMKCPACARYSCVMSERSIGKHGPICLKCGHVLNPRTGVWIDMVVPDREKPLIKGFHIPQAIMPANVPVACLPDARSQEKAQSNWLDILYARENDPPAKFRNEVLGVSDAIGQRLVSLDELKALCTGPAISDKPRHDLGQMKGVSVVAAGIDWSGGGSTGLSRTVLWVWGWDQLQQKLKTLYFKIYPSGTHATTDAQDIIQVLQHYNPATIFADAGEGYLPNSMLQDTFGKHRVWQIQYGGFKKPIDWNGVDRWLTDRSTVIDAFMMFLKTQRAILPPYEECKTAIADVLNEYEEVTPAGKKVWHHSPQLPDDCLHAMLFGWIGWKMQFNDLKFLG